jgi:hypothetical protein
MIFFPLFTLCSAFACALVIVLSGSPFERIEKWENRPIFKEDRRAFSYSIYDEKCRIIRGIESDGFQDEVGIHE